MSNCYLLIIIKVIDFQITVSVPGLSYFQRIRELCVQWRLNVNLTPILIITSSNYAIILICFSRIIYRTNTVEFESFL